MARGAGGGGSNVIQIILKAQDAASKVVQTVAKSVTRLKGTFDGVAGVAQKISFIGIAFQQIQGIIAGVQASMQGFYNAFIGSNVQLQEQLLSTQASLAATNKVLRNGVEIQDPTEAIQALEGPVRDTLEYIRQESLSLVGVTSAELVPLFQVLAQESSNIGASLQDAGDLTVDFAAALGTLGIPLDFARQEITSILQGQINSDSQLAKSIGLNNEQVKLWKQQGTLVENLRAKLEAFRAGNALAAQTIGGVSSNILEIIQEVTRIAGEPLLAPIVEEISGVYAFLEANRDRIQEAVNSAIAIILKISEPVRNLTREIGGELLKLGAALTTNFGEELKAVFTVAVAALQASTVAILGLTKKLVQALTFVAESPVTAKIVDVLSKIAQVVAGVVTSAFNKLSELAAGLSARLQPAGDAVGGIGAALERLRPTFEAIAAAVKSGLALAFDLMRVAINNAIGVTAAFVTNAIRLVDVLSGPLRAVLTALAPLIKTAFGTFTTVAGGVLKLATAAIGELAKRFEQARDILRDLGLIKEQVGPGLQGLEGTLGSAEEAFANFGASAGLAASDVQLLGDPIKGLEQAVQQASTEIEKNQLRVDVDQSGQLATLQEQLQQGLISESEFQEQREAITRQGLEKQLAVVTEQVNALKAQYASLSEEEKLQAGESLDQILKLEKQQNDLRQQVAEAGYQEQQKALEKAQKEALDVVKRAETERQIEIQKLRNAGAISEEEAAVELSKATQERIQGELEAEQEKLDQIISSQGAQSSAAREQQQKVLELTKQSLEEEERLYEAQTALIRKQLSDRAQAFENQLERQNQQLEQQKQLYDSLDSALQNQTRLLEAGRNLQQAQVDALTSSLGIVAELETSEVRRRKLQQAAAIARLEALRESQRIENQTAEIQRIQNRLALERRDIENQIAIAKQKAAIAQQEVEVAVAQRDLQAGKISQEEFDAQVLGLQAQQQALEGLQAERAIIDQERQIAPILEQLEAATREQQQQTAVNQARAEVVQTAAPADRRRLSQQLQQDLLGTSSTNFVQQQDAAINQFLRDEFSPQGGQGGGFLDQVSPDRFRAADFAAATSGLAGLPPTSQLAANLPAAGAIAPQFEPLAAGIGALQPLQTEANGLLAAIAQNTAGAGAAGVTLNVTVNAATNAPDDIAQRVATESRAALRSVLLQGRQLAAEAA